jgi:phenylpropionate dioxygenase-like ring-hydroxylating dioxygenase large terminal subunit
VFSQLPSDTMPAPVARDRLLPALAPLGQSRMLPREAYVDAGVFAWEHRHFFGGWVCAGRTADVAAPGDQRAVSLGDSGVLLTRDEQGVLHGFANVCRHRGHELLPCGANAHKRAIVCPYHAWTYRLDGSLQVAPSFEKVDDFDPSGLGLLELPVQEWHGWVFVDRSGSAGAFAHHVGALEDIVAPYSPGGLRTLVRHDYEVAANWKIIVENYQECYHCSMIHPELCQVSPPESGANLDLPGDWVGGWMDLRPEAATMSLDGRSGGVAIAGLQERELRTVMYVAVFPNLLVSLHPDYVMTHLVTPLDVDRTRIECAWAFPAAAAEREGFDPAYAVDFWDLTNRQDWAACESVQRGLASQHSVAGPLAPEEDGVYHFVNRVARGYLGLGPDDQVPTA